jgi:hypothetical protein
MSVVNAQGDQQEHVQTYQLIGKKFVLVIPVSGRLSIAIVPPSNSTMDLAMASPSPVPSLSFGPVPSPRRQTYRTARKKPDTARRVQTTIPANANRRTRAGQEDSQIQSPTMMGRNNTQTMISATAGNARTQFQSKSSHSRFTTSAIANPTHRIAKITMAYVLSTRETVTLQNDESLIAALLVVYHTLTPDDRGHCGHKPRPEQS